MSNTITSKLSFKEKVGYSSGDLASRFVWDMVNFWMVFFYTDIFGISPLIAGAIVAAGSIWDAVVDPIVGIVSDRTNSRWGKFRPYLLFGSVPLAIILVLAFTTPAFNPTAMIIYASVTALLLRTAYAFVNLPYSSLSAVMTPDTAERTGLNTYRFIAANMGQLIVSGAALYMVAFFGKWGSADGAVNQQQGIQYTVMLFAALSIVFFYITFKTTKERIQPPKHQDTSVKKDLKYLFLNKPWIVLTVVSLISFIMFAMQNSATVFYFKYYIGNAESVQLFNILGTLAIIAALPMSKPLAKRFGNKNVFIASSIFSGIFFTLIFAAGTNVILINTFNCLAKIAYAPAIPLIWTMIADAADFGEWKFNRRITGLCFSAAVFAQKVGWAIGAAAGTWVLAASNYVPNAADQTPEAIMGMRLLVSAIPGVLYASCAIFMAFYMLDAKTTNQMKIDLEAKRAEE